MIFCLPKLLPFLRALWLNKALEPTTSCFSEPFVEKGPKSWSNIHGKKNPGWVIYLGALLKICLKKGYQCTTGDTWKVAVLFDALTMKCVFISKKKLRIKKTGGLKPARNLTQHNLPYVSQLKWAIWEDSSRIDFCLKSSKTWNHPILFASKCWISKFRPMFQRHLTSSLVNPSHPACGFLSGRRCTAWVAPRKGTKSR